MLGQPPEVSLLRHVPGGSLGALVGVEPGAYLVSLTVCWGRCSIPVPLGGPSALFLLPGYLSSLSGGS